MDNNNEQGIEQESVNQRLVALVDFFERGKKAAFARKAGISPQAAQEMLAGRRSEPSFKVLVKILQSYPQVCTDWLVLGRGPMLQDESINTATKQLVYATAEQYEKAQRLTEERQAMRNLNIGTVNPQLAAQLRLTEQAEKAKASALQEALMRIYSVGDSYGDRLAVRLAVSEETALQLVTSGKIRGTGLLSHSSTGEYEEPTIAGYRISELAVREFLGEPIKYESPWNMSFQKVIGVPPEPELPPTT